jgi:hypothetical protein
MNGGKAKTPPVNPHSCTDPLYGYERGAHMTAGAWKSDPRHRQTHSTDRQPCHLKLACSASPTRFPARLAAIYSSVWYVSDSIHHLPRPGGDAPFTRCAPSSRERPRPTQSGVELHEGREHCCWSGVLPGRIFVHCGCTHHQWRTECSRLTARSWTEQCRSITRRAIHSTPSPTSKSSHVTDSDLPGPAVY